MKNIIVAFFGCALLFGCSSEKTKKTPEKLFEECASGLVLIHSKYYYQVTLPTGQTLYMSDIGKDGTPVNLTIDEDDIKKQTSGMSGTGFFIDNEGHILTSRHLVKGNVDERKAEEQIVLAMRRNRKAYFDSMLVADDAYTDLNDKKSKCYRRDAWGNIFVHNKKRLREINDSMSVRWFALHQWEQLYNYLAANLSKRVKIKLISQIGIAYNNTRMEDMDDSFYENTCVIRKVSKKDRTDLAVIQLKIKATPGFAHVFDTSGRIMKEKEKKTAGDYINELLYGEQTMEEFDADKLSKDQKLYMIGYNRDMKLVLGKPIREKCSGSPVIDEDGNLRGVNFSITMKQVKTFLKE